MNLQALVSTKAPDPAAVTAFGALRERLGFTSVLGGLGRASYVELSTTKPLPAGEPPVAESLAKTTLLANPTKEIVRTSEEGLDIAGVGILVWWREGVVDTSLEGRIARQFPGWPPFRVLRATLWLPVITAPLSEVRSVVDRIADAGRRTTGLLRNPHSQDMCVVEDVIPPRVLFESLERTPAQ